MNTDERLRMTALQQLDQLTAGLSRNDPMAEADARCLLVTISREGSTILLCEVFEAIADKWEKTR